MLQIRPRRMTPTQKAHLSQGGDPSAKPLGMLPCSMRVKRASSQKLRGTPFPKVRIVVRFPMASHPRISKNRSGMKRLARHRLVLT
jgi:hypothetical protein